MSSSICPCMLHMANKLAKKGCLIKKIKIDNLLCEKYTQLANEAM